MELNKKMEVASDRERADTTTKNTRVNDSTKPTQYQVVLEELRKHKEDGITSWDMIASHRITRTAAHICTLKKLGFGIVSKLETNNGKQYSRYFLTDDIEDWGQF